MFDRLDQLEARYEDLGRQMSDPTLVQDQKKFQSIAKQHRDMEPTVEKFREYRKIKDGIAEAKAMLADPDPEVKEMAQAELDTLEPRLSPVEEQLKVLLLPKDPNDEKNVILETAFEMDFKPGAKAGTRASIKIDSPGAYLVRIETKQTQSDHEHFAAIDLVVE